MMVYTALTKAAMKAAFNAHIDQLDKGGLPYFNHVLHVAEQMDDEESCIVALLHDVIEDGKMSESDLERIYPDDVMNALMAITKPKRMDYMEYIGRVKQNAIASRVKVADLRHNMDRSRLKAEDRYSEKTNMRQEKYAAALRVLLDKEEKR